MHNLGTRNCTNQEKMQLMLAGSTREEIRISVEEARVNSLKCHKSHLITLFNDDRWADMSEKGGVTGEGTSIMKAC